MAAKRKSKKSDIKIDPKEVGSLKRIAKREGGLKANGEINKTWARKKMNNPRTSAAVKKKINFFLNFNKG